MDIFRFADKIGRELIIRRHPRQRSRFTCEFERSEIKVHQESSVLISEYGDGRTVNDALANYVMKIRGKVLVFNATDPDSRIVLMVPNSLFTIKV